MEPEAKKNPRTWRVSGRLFKKEETGSFVEGVIDLPQPEGNLQMRERPGLPTPKPEQPSSVALPDKASFGMPIDANLAVHLIRNGLQASELFFTEYQPLAESPEQKKLYSFIGNALNLTYGITFDKSLMLKILSQPNCEGLRAYLCAREEADGYHVSLVMSGVDQNGFDLNYPDELQKEGEIETMSLLAEYGYPPGGTNTAGIDEHYILLNAAAAARPEE